MSKNNYFQLNVDILLIKGIICNLITICIYFTAVLSNLRCLVSQDKYELNLYRLYRTNMDYLFFKSKYKIYTLHYIYINMHYICL